jgi:hypothetical protein
VDDLRPETFGVAFERYRDLGLAQVASYERLLESTRAANEALRTHDADRFEEVLAAQIETLRELKELEGERRRLLREVGDTSGAAEIRHLREDLARLAEEVSRAQRVQHLVIERNGALVEARLALRRRAGVEGGGSATPIRRLA